MKNKNTDNQKETIRGVRDEILCSHFSLEKKIEDYTHSILGQELTRRIEVLNCLDCGEKCIAATPILEMEAEMKAKVISLANERLKVPRSFKRHRRNSLIRQVPEGYNYLKYYDEVDLLFIRFGNQKSVRTEDDALEGLIFNFDKDKNLVSIEIIDFYDKFVTNEPDDQN